MRVLVMGGGIVGVTTAYQLVQDGHEVVLVERREGAALETSWGNAGMIAPGHSFAWSSPQAPMILLKSLFAKNQALRFRPSADPRLWAWSLLFLRQCTEERARINTLRKHRLCLYSQKILHGTIAGKHANFTSAFRIHKRDADQRSNSNLNRHVWLGDFADTLLRFPTATICCE